MSPYRRRRHVPHWWPEHEAWPPRDPAWRRRRARFMGRLAIFFSLIWSLSAIGAISLVARLSHGASTFYGGRIAAVALMLAIVLVAFVVAFRRVGSPIGDLVGAAHRIADGDFSVRVAEHGPPPVRAVAAAFNEMASRLARQEQQRRDLMAEIAHELRNPLSIVQGRLEGLIDGVYPRDAEQLEPLLEETRVLTRLVEDLRTLANAESGVLALDREPTDIGMLLRDAVSAISQEASARSVVVTIDDRTGGQTVHVDPVRIRQVVINLVSNAIRHSPDGTTVRLDARISDAALAVNVVDTGPGILPDELPKIFDRFHKARGSSGSGLGLTIARTLIRAHGGEIYADSGPGAGTTMTFTVPVA